MTLVFFLTSLFLATPFIHARVRLGDVIGQDETRRVLESSNMDGSYSFPETDATDAPIFDVGTTGEESHARRKREAFFGWNPFGFLSGGFDENQINQPNIPYVLMPVLLGNRQLSFDETGAIPSYSGSDPRAVPYNDRGLGLGGRNFDDSIISGSPGGGFSESSIGAPRGTTSLGF